MITGSQRKWLQSLLGNNVLLDEPMARHTSLGIGGPADALALPVTVDQLIRLVRWCRENGLPLTIIGGGTNILVRDGGIRGITVRLSNIASRPRITPDNQGGVLVSANAGIETRHICATALKKALAGMNFALGIPGTLGGAIQNNAGTASGRMADVLEALTVIDSAGQLKRCPHEILQADYRRPAIPGNGPLVILEAEIRLSPGDKSELAAEARKLIRRRVASQPIWKPSAGCFFKNPSPDTPAGMLIDKAGLKGAAVGDARVSRRHANFIFNAGKATAEQVLELAAMIQAAVTERFAIDLEPEVKVLGEAKRQT